MPGNSLLDGVDPVDPPEGDDLGKARGSQEGQDPSGEGQDPGANEYTAPASQEELDQLIQQRLDAAEADRLKDRPENAEGYTIPEIEGLDAEELQGSTVFQTMRSAAHEAGMSQASFDKFVADWAEAEKAEVETYRDEQMALLGTDEQAVKTRLGTLSGALTRMLPKDEAEALLGAAASAGVVKALERLISKSPAPKLPPRDEAKDDAATIASLMNSKEYMGMEHERDPKVVARVDAFFAAGGTLKSS